MKIIVWTKDLPVLDLEIVDESFVLDDKWLQFRDIENRIIYVNVSNIQSFILKQ